MKKDYEKIGIFISMAGSFLLSGSAVIMAVIAHSQAILLDGLYTLITLLMSLVSLKIINLVNLPETKHRPFGYVVLEPFLNLIKSFIILILLLACMVTNIQTLLNGGRNLYLDTATIYTFICIAIYVTIICSIKKCEKKNTSSILALEVKNWYIDTLITIGIAFSLGIVLIIYKLGFDSILPYIDPSLVILIVLVSLPVPLKSLLCELKRLLLISPENLIEDEVKKQIKEVIDKYKLTKVDIFGVKTGRTYQLYIYTSIKNENITIDYLDIIRQEIRNEVSKLYERHYTDVIFSNLKP